MTFEFLIMFALSVLLSLPYCVIATLVLVCGKDSNLQKDPNYRPSVTVFIPTFNEENYIARKLEDLLRQTYPIAEILVFDCSTDNTREIIRTYKSRYSFIRLIEQSERMGMARTFNEALQNSIGEILVKTDCDSITKSEGSLANLVSCLADSQIGGVTGKCDSRMGTEGYFRAIMTRIQVAESNIDSTIIGHSTSLLALRRNACNPVSNDSMAEDSEEMVLLRKSGYRTVIDTSVISEEEVPSNLTTRQKQKSRRAEGIIRALMENRDMLLNSHFGKFGLLVLPMDIFILSVSPFVLIILLPLIFYLAFQISIYLFSALLAVTLAAASVKPSLAFAILDTQFNSLRATFRTLFSVHQPEWEKVR